MSNPILVQKNQNLAKNKNYVKCGWQQISGMPFKSPKWYLAAVFILF